MTTEQRFKKLEEALTVEAELLARHERLDEERHARIDEKFEALANILEDWAEKMKELRDGELTTKAALDRLIEHMDTFMKGRSGNGRRKGN